MNFEFSDDEKMIQEQAHGFLAKHACIENVRKILDTERPYDRELWQGIVDMGWTGTVIPEAYGGLELGYSALCVIAEELGRSLAPVPFSSSVYLATELLLEAGSEAQKNDYLPRLAAGELIGTLAYNDGVGTRCKLDTRVRDGRIYGSVVPVVDGDVADFAVVAARAEEAEPLSLYLVDLKAEAVIRRAVQTIDPTRSAAEVTFDGAPATQLGKGGDAEAILARVFNRAAVLFAFEQLGGAQACLEMARNYAMERYAFGRPVASFQAIKHKLADVYTGIELLRSNAMYAVMALSSAAPDFELAAATARVAGIQAYNVAVKENIQTHGGMGFTWEFDCHLYYRRAHGVSVAIGNEGRWKHTMVEELKHGKAA